MDHLAERMDAGIGPSGADDVQRNLGELLQRLLQRILDRSSARLLLPAAESAALIFDRQGDPHSSGRRERKQRYQADQQQRHQHVVAAGEAAIAEF